jgi:hypothetical protein
VNTSEVTTDSGSIDTTWLVPYVQEDAKKLSTLLNRNLVEEWGMV